MLELRAVSCRRQAPGHRDGCQPQRQPSLGGVGPDDPAMGLAGAIGSPDAAGAQATEDAGIAPVDKGVHGARRHLARAPWLRMAPVGAPRVVPRLPRLREIRSGRAVSYGRFPLRCRLGVGTERYLVRPEQPWSVGDRYRLRVDAGPDHPGPATRQRVAEFSIGEPLGDRHRELEPVELAVSELQQGELGFIDRSGPCGASHEAAHVDVDFPTPDAATSWPREFLEYRTFVDGFDWNPPGVVCQDVDPGGSRTSRTGNTTATTCDSGLADGTRSLLAGR